MRKYFIENLKKITALLLVASMTMTMNVSAVAQDIIVSEDTDNLNQNEEITDIVEEDTLDNISELDEEARERESMPASKTFCNKLLKYLDIKYPLMNLKVPDAPFNDYSSYTSKMGQQVVYDEIVIDGDDPEVAAIAPELTKNMVQFKILGCFGDSIGSDDSGNQIYNDTVKTLIIRNVDEIRNLYVPASVETLIIENTTLNCYQYPSDSPGFQSGMNPGDLSYCKNLKKLVLKNVAFGDNYKRGKAANLLNEITKDCPYETNYVLNLQNCTELEDLVIDVSFAGAREVQLTINGGTENLFGKLTDEKCSINPAPGTGYGQVNLYANANSRLAKSYQSSETVEFKNKQFRLWLLEALGIDTNNDGVISQDEMDAIDTLVLNDQTAHSAPQTSLSAFEELADIQMFHKLKTLEIDFYDPTLESKDYRHTLKGIDYPGALENLTLKNVYWEKDTETKSHDNADIILTNLRTLELRNTEVKTGSGDTYFEHPTQIVLTDTEGALQSCIIEKTDVESIHLINNSDGKGIKDDDEKQRIRFSASDCQKLKNVEFLGEGYAVEGSLNLANDAALTHIGVPNADKTQWTVNGEFDSTYAPINVILNSCPNLGSDCEGIVIDYDFINGRSINVQALDTKFSDAHKLIIYRKPRIDNEVAGKVYLSCDVTDWIYKNYTVERIDEQGVSYREAKDGFVIENRTSFPSIAVFANGQRIRTSGEGNHNNDSKYTEDTDCWVERWNLVMSPGGYSANFGNLTFYVIDPAVTNPENESENVGTLRRVFYPDHVYVEWDKQNTADSIITLPTVRDDETGGYKLNGTKLSSTGVPGEVELKLYVYDGNGDKSYIGFQNIKVFGLPDSVELVNDGTERGSGTKDDPFIIKKNEELKLKARPLVNNVVDRSGDFALRDVYWRIKEYDETPKYTSDSDGYSLYTLDSATKAGISVIRGKLNDGESEAQYDRRVDTSAENGQEATYYNHRRLTFNTAGSKFKIVAQSPYKSKDGEVISSEVYVEVSDKPVYVDVSNDKKLIHGKNGWDETTITIHNTDDTDIVDVSIKNPELYEGCFVVARDSSSTDSKEVWKLKINGNDNSKIKNIINNKKSLTLVIKTDDKKVERVISLSSVFPDTESFWCSEIEDQTYTGKTIKPKLNIYNGKLRLIEGKDYTLSYGKNTNVLSKNAIDKKGKRIGPSITITGKGNFANKQTYYFSIVPRSIESTAKVDDIIVAKTGKDIKISPIVTLDGKKLKQGTDYIVSTTEREIVSLKEPQEYTLYVVGKGNYTGTIPFRFTITESVPANKVSIQKIANQRYNDGAEVKPDIKILYNKKDVTDCFDISYENNTEIGTATVVATSIETSEGKDFTGKAGYSFHGIKKATFKINGLNISDTKLGITGKEKMPEFTYSGQRYKPSINLYYKTGTKPLEEGKDYTITYKNNINAGTAAAIITGKGKYTGTKKLTFKINKYDAGKDKANVIAINNGEDISVNYEKGGVTPKPTISMYGVVLTEKKDYTISYANNKAVAKSDAVNARGKSVAPTLIVTFKGNLSGKKLVPFTITSKDIILGKITLADKPVSTKENAWKQTAATIVDTNGKKLTAGTDYSKTLEYYSNLKCTDAITKKTLDADTTVYVKVTGIKNYEGSYIVGSYRISKTNISTVTARIDNKAYTGTEICPSAGDITVTVGPKNKKTPLVPGKDYEVVEESYKKNINKGTASLTIRGKGDYYGTKVVKYNIVVNKISWWIW